MARAEIINLNDYAETHVGSVKDLLDSFVVCRTVGHSWDDNPNAEWQTQWSWWFALRCTRCGCERLDALGLTGDVISRNYRYPDGYRVTRNRQGGKITRGELRRELMRRRILARRRESNASKKTGRKSS